LKKPAQPPPAPKSAWKKPVLTRLGNLKDLVQGGGKSGSNVDHDPRSSRKKGTG
jgi:hypothetical protein